jgi:ABC-type branched-subunit amino acid transport system ATPase component
LVASEGLTIVMVEQFVQTALSVADEAAIMVNGELVKRGKPADVHSEVVSAYLGGETAGASFA